MKKYIKIISTILIIVIITGLVFVLVNPKPKISANNKVLSISLSNTITDVKASYVAPTVSKVQDNLFEFNFTGSKNKVRIGTGTSNFVGKMLFGAWDDECLIDLQMENITGNLGKATLSGTGETASITIENNAWKLEYKPTKPASGFNEYGGIDYLMTIKRKTSYNTINFTYNATNCLAYPQPPLTQEYTAGWSDEFQCEIAVTETQVTRVSDSYILVERPAHVVNSIVFYHATKGGTVTQTDADRGIGTGKIGTLYSMKVTDSSATPKTTWAKWTLNGSIVTLTIPLEFMQTANFPVVISPVGDTFGYGETGASGRFLYYGTNKRIRGVLATGAAGNATSISAYMRSDGTESANAKAALYLSSDSSLVVASSDTNTSFTASFEWKNFSIPSTVISAIDYVIAVMAAADVTYYPINVAYDTTGDNLGRHYTVATYTTFADPASFTTVDEKYSIYCTYTPSASYDISGTPSTKAFGITTDSTTYWAIGHTPDNPIDDAHCTFTLTNSGDACDIDGKMADFTGGVGWNIGAPAENQARVTWFKSGDNPASGIVLTNADQEVYDSLAAAGHFHWDFKLETPTSVTDGVEKSGVLTLTARAHT